MKRFITLMFMVLALSLSLVTPSFAWQDAASQEAPKAEKKSAKKEKKPAKEKKAKAGKEKKEAAPKSEEAPKPPSQ